MNMFRPNHKEKRSKLRINYDKMVNMINENKSQLSIKALEGLRRNLRDFGIHETDESLKIFHNSILNSLHKPANDQLLLNNELNQKQKMAKQQDIKEHQYFKYSKDSQNDQKGEINYKHKNNGTKEKTNMKKEFSTQTLNNVNSPQNQNLTTFNFNTQQRLKKISQMKIKKRQNISSEDQKRTHFRSRKLKIKTSLSSVEKLPIKKCNNPVFLIKEDPLILKVDRLLELMFKLKKSNVPLKIQYMLMK